MLPKKWYINRSNYSTEECKEINLLLNKIFQTDDWFSDYGCVISYGEGKRLSDITEDYTSIDKETLNLIAILHDRRAIRENS